MWIPHFCSFLFPLRALSIFKRLEMQLIAWEIAVIWNSLRAREKATLKYTNSSNYWLTSKMSGKKFIHLIENIWGGVQIYSSQGNFRNTTNFFFQSFSRISIGNVLKVGTISYDQTTLALMKSHTRE